MSADANSDRGKRAVPKWNDVALFFCVRAIYHRHISSTLPNLPVSMRVDSIRGFCLLRSRFP